MKYAIIAAGEGSRLAEEHVGVPKPLVSVAGERLIDRLLRVFTDNGADEIVCICNERDSQVAGHLLEVQHDGLQGRSIPLRYVVKTTFSSMHSFYELSPFLSDSPFILTTVDTVFREDEFARFVADFKVTEADGLMGVTTLIDDERPLYVRTDDSLRITAFLDEAENCPFVSAGIYGLGPSTIGTLRRCMERSESRMRNFQRALVAEGQRLIAWPFTTVFDVDHVADIRKAEDFLQHQAYSKST